MALILQLSDWMGVRLSYISMVVILQMAGWEVLIKYSRLRRNTLIFIVFSVGLALTWITDHRRGDNSPLHQKYFSEPRSYVWYIKYLHTGGWYMWCWSGAGCAVYRVGVCWCLIVCGCVVQTCNYNISCILKPDFIHHFWVLPSFSHFFNSLTLISTEFFTFWTFWFYS